ncbi:MAG: hypothetical protein K2K05_06155 [Muribaculaceae bacterium]|nr:hypothetical protein [Muribaculaceae bacterium]
MMKSISIRRDLLLYDIANYAFIEGHRTETMTGEPEKAHLLTDICAEGNIDRVNRVLGLAHASAVEILYPLTRRRNVFGRIANEIWTPEVYPIRFRCDVRLPDTTAHLLARLIHEYMVCKAVHDWLSITDPTASARWAEKCAEAASALRQCTLTATQSPLTRRPSPW